MNSRSNDIIFLLGAGASVEAGIPASSTMIDKIEDLITQNDEWEKHCILYNHVKSAIHFAAGIKGNFSNNVAFNIETLVNTLYELERNEEHPLYPFIAAWNSRFVNLAGENFSSVGLFRRLILRELKRWMCPDNALAAAYYRGFITLQRALNYPLHIFSLNYDLCMERISRDGFRVETGFSEYGPNHFWDWERFEQAGNGPEAPPDIYLYKLHGSINWKRDEAHNLFSVEQIENVPYDRMEVIFGRNFKLEAADPYLFYAYHFRRFALDAKLITIVGYSFADDHINKMLSQALRREKTRKILVVTSCNSSEECTKKQNEIGSILDVKIEQVEVVEGTAKQFLERSDVASLLRKKIPQPEDSPF